jgi:hypothetical protein
LRRKIGGTLTGRTWWRLGAVSTAVAAACQFSHGVSPPDGSGSAVPDAGTCTSLVPECVGDTLRYCMMIGGSAMDLPCGWGCLPGSDAHCAHVIPSGSGGVETNGVLPSDVDGTGLADITLVDGEQLDSDNGRIGTLVMPNLHHGAVTGVDLGIDFQFRGPISVWRFKSLTINGTVTLIGKRPIALVSDGAVTINGIVDARGICSAFNAGPGGFNGGSANSANGSSAGTTLGGGQGAPDPTGAGAGGGYGTAGGNASGTTGGQPYGTPEIATLFGGAGGGAGDGGGNFGRGGGGGGGLQIISNTRIAIPTGGINAGGCGGKAGIGNADSGGGGGAGGTILLEAPTVTVGGTLAANGGGGGGGGGGNAKPGKDGTLDRMPAAGGDPDGNDEGGGSGAAGATAAGSGSNGTNPGGGGGGLGRIRINTRGGSGFDGANATLSPGPAELLFSTGSATTR